MKWHQLSWGVDPMERTDVLNMLLLCSVFKSYTIGEWFQHTMNYSSSPRSFVNRFCGVKDWYYTGYENRLISYFQKMCTTTKEDYYYGAKVLEDDKEENPDVNMN